jgi:hypothetical protein
MEVFGLTKEGGANFSRFQNYWTFGNALVMLAFMSTGLVSFSILEFQLIYAEKDGMGICTISECYWIQ